MPSLMPHPLRNALGGMLAMAAAMGIGRVVYTPILPGMMQALGQTPSIGAAVVLVICAIVAWPARARNSSTKLKLGKVGVPATLVP